MSFFGGGGGDNMMSVTINGVNLLTPVVAQAADALTSLAPAAQEAAAQTNEALGTMGAAGQEAFVGTNGLARTAQIASDSVQRSLGSGPTGLMGFFSSFGQGLGQIGDGIMGFGNQILGALNPLNLFHSSVLRLVEVMSLWRLFDQGLQSVTAFVDGIWQIPIAMQKAEGSWQYMFNPAQQPGQSLQAWQQQGQAIAGQISDWTKIASLSLPYTRQDLIAGISSMSTVGLSESGIEHYLPVIADISAARNPSLQLQQAAYAIRGEYMGYKRMLAYELNINPQLLESQYGYDLSNAATLLPALEKYAQAQGYTSYNAKGQDVGSAYNISHTTFWGEYSSFLDRVQNLQLATGDAGPFPALQKGLEWLNNFIDLHSADLNKFANLLGDTIAGGMKSVANAGQSLLQGIGSTGVLTDFVNSFGQLGKWLGDANTQKGIDSFIQLAGKNIGLSAQGFGQGFSSLMGGIGQAWQGMGSSGQTSILNALTIPGMLASILGQGAGGVGSSFGYLWNMLGADASIPFRLGGDIATGQPGRIGPDIGTWQGTRMRDYGQFLTHAIEPAGGIYDTIMNWAGHPTHGAGKHWMDQSFLPTISNIVPSIGNWLGGIGGGIGSAAGSVGNWFGGVGSAIGGAAQGVGNWFGGVGGAIGGAAGGVGNWMGQTGGAIGGAVSGLAQRVSQQFQDMISAPQRFFDWLYAHNYYFQDFVDTMNRGLENLKNGFTMAFQVVSAQVHQALESIKQTITGAWNEITSVVTVVGGIVEQKVKATWNTIKNDAQVAWTGISTALGLVWTTIENDAKQAWGKFTSAIDQATKPIRDKIAALADGIKVGIETAVNQAEQWGENLVNNLITGLRKNLTLVGNTAKDVANELWKNLGFHSPTQEGPGATADQWAPNFMRMFNQGLLAGIPQIAATAGQMAAALGQGIVNNTTNNATTYGAQTIHIHVAQMTANDVAALTGGSRYAQTLRAPGGYRQFGGVGGVLG